MKKENSWNIIKSYLYRTECVIENLETLVALYKEGTMMEASTALKISQSAVSKRIANLERYYDRKLIERILIY